VPLIHVPQYPRERPLPGRPAHRVRGRLLGHVQHLEEGFSADVPYRCGRGHVSEEVGKVTYAVGEAGGHLAAEGGLHLEEARGVASDSDAARLTPVSGST
jgi:hypothetical protein